MCGGNVVIIDHGLGLFSGYWHLSEIQVAVGQVVERGTVLGLMGNTGLVTGPHLHWEMRLGGIAVEPLPMGARKYSLRKENDHDETV